MTEPRSCRTARPARRYDPECSGPPEWDVLVYEGSRVLMRTPSCYRHGADEEERARRAGGIAKTRMVPVGENQDWEPGGEMEPLIEESSLGTTGARRLRAMGARMMRGESVDDAEMDHPEVVEEVRQVEAELAQPRDPLMDLLRELRASGASKSSLEHVLRRPSTAEEPDRLSLVLDALGDCMIALQALASEGGKVDLSPEQLRYRHAASDVHWVIKRLAGS